MAFALLNRRTLETLQSLKARRAGTVNSSSHSTPLSQSTTRRQTVTKCSVVAMTVATTLLITGFAQSPTQGVEPRPLMIPPVTESLDLTSAQLHVHHTRIIESFVTDSAQWRSLSATPLATLRANVSTYPSYRRVVIDTPSRSVGTQRDPVSVKPMFRFRGVGFPQIETTVAASESSYKPYRDLIDVVTEESGDQLAIPQVACHGMSAQRTLVKSSAYNGRIKALAERYDVSAYLVKAVMAQESCFRPNARSYVGATGLMQLMPETAAWLGVKDIHNTDENLRAGVRYLAQLKRRFKRDDLALAAYNAGPGTVERHGGIPPYPETEQYVKHVQFYKLAYITADRFNLKQQIAADEQRQSAVRHASKVTDSAGSQG